MPRHSEKSEISSPLKIALDLVKRIRAHERAPWRRPFATGSQERRGSLEKIGSNPFVQAEMAISGGSMTESTAKAGSKAVPRAARGKRIDPPSNEQTALAREIASLTRAAQKKLVLSTKQTGFIINREPKTMEADRRKQRALVAAGKGGEIDPTHPMSLPYVPARGDEREVHYIASDVVDFLNRRYATVDRSFLKRGAPLPADPAMRGFQSWLALGSASDTWPFCVQPDGRPLDMAEAIATGRLGDDVERLNLREFSARLADAASRASSRGEAAVVARATKRTKSTSAKAKSRWDKPGGPI